MLKVSNSQSIQRPSHSVQLLSEQLSQKSQMYKVTCPRLIFSQVGFIWVLMKYFFIFSHFWLVIFLISHFFPKQVTYAFNSFFTLTKHLLVLNFEYCKIFIETIRSVLLICSHKWMTKLIKSHYDFKLNKVTLFLIQGRGWRGGTSLQLSSAVIIRGGNQDGRVGGHRTLGSFIWLEDWWD